MDVKVENARGATVISVAGHMDGHSVRDLRKQIEDLVAESKEAPRIVFDLSGVEFADSSGLSTMIATFQQVTSKGGRVVFAGLKGQVSRVFRSTHLHRILEVKTTTDEALDFLETEQGDAEASGGA